MNITVSEFKVNCLKLVDEVATTHKPLVISKHGKPWVKLIPIVDETQNSMFGYMKGTVTIHGDIVAPLDEEWTVETDDETDLYAGFWRHKDKRL